MATDRIAGVGAGAAGIMSACRPGAAWVTSLTLYDLAGDVLQLRSGSPRLIHPHIYEWPAMGSLESRAGLPFLDWEEGWGADVSDQLRVKVQKIKTALPALISKGGIPLQFLDPEGAEWRLGFGALGFREELLVAAAVELGNYPA